ncbi:MAG: hypothetical protein WKG01_29850 [Kofleriaceae bacterium]
MSRNREERKLVLLAVIVDGEWSISPNAFRAALKARWPTVTFTELDDTWDYAFRWANADPDVWEGQLDRNGRGLALRGTLEGAARITCWFRAMVPTELSMWFVDEGNNAHVDATPELSPELLAAAYIAAANREA